MSQEPETIYDRIKLTRIEAGLTQEDFSASIGIKRGNLANIELGKQLPTLATITEIVTKYGRTYEWIITGKGVQGNLEGNAHPNAHLNAHPIDQKGQESYTKRVGMEHVVDTQGMKLVPIVDIRAAAGDGYINPETLDANDVIRLPSTLVKSGYHLCIRIKGASMAPTYQDGGYLIIRLLDRSAWSTLPNERCYVVVDTEGKTYIKRVKNRFSGNDGGFIVLSSDSPDKMSHPNFNLHPHEISFIWYVEWYFTAKMPNIHDQYYSRVSNLEDKVDLLQESLEKIQKQLK